MDVKAKFYSPSRIRVTVEDPCSNNMKVLMLRGGFSNTVDVSFWGLDGLEAIDLWL